MDAVAQRHAFPGGENRTRSPAGYLDYSARIPHDLEAILADRDLILSVLTARARAHNLAAEHLGKAAQLIRDGKAADAHALLDRASLSIGVTNAGDVLANSAELASRLATEATAAGDAARRHYFRAGGECIRHEFVDEAGGMCPSCTRYAIGLAARRDDAFSPAKWQTSDPREDLEHGDVFVLVREDHLELVTARIEGSSVLADEDRARTLHAEEPWPDGWTWILVQDPAELGGDA